MSRLTFEPGSHKYKLDGKPLTGCTTILGVIAKPALIGWAAKESAKFIKENIKFDKDGNVKQKKEEVLEIIEQAPKAHSKKKTDAGNIGTEFHSWVERYTKTNEKPQIQENATKLFVKMAENFDAWVKNNKVKFLGSEEMVYSENDWYAGTFDFLCEIDGKTYIGDLKTSNGIYGREYFFQMAGYRKALEEMGTSHKLAGSVVVRCGKDGSFEEKYSYDYETDLKGFLAALTLYRALKTF